VSDTSPLITSVFGIWGDQLNPAECTRAIGLTPTEVEIKGQDRPEGRPPVPVTHWGITLEKRRSYSIEEPLSELLDLLWPQRERVVEFITSHPVSAAFSTNITINNDRPEYCLSPKTLQRLAYFKVEYCLDIFDYSD